MPSLWERLTSTMAILYLQRRFGNDNAVHYERRHYGKTLDKHTAGCPLYKSNNIARYEWD